MIKPLTSLRFFFAMMVFVSHLQFFSKEDLFFHKIYDTVFYEGYLGVSFFFILSGFILSLNYKDRLLKKEAVAKEFWIARFARIYPLYLLTLLIAVPLTLPGIKISLLPSLLKFLCNLFLLQSFIPTTAFYYSFNAPSWSISCEMLFYLLFPFIVTIGRQRRAILSVIPVFLIPVGIHFFPENLLHRLFYINPVFRLVDFLIGILIFDLYQTTFLHKIFKSALTATFIEILSITIFIIFFSLHRHIPQGYRYSCYYWIPMVLIILAFAYQKGYLSVALSGKLFVQLGEISFGFYLIHHLSVRYILALNATLHLINNDYLLTCIIFTVSLIASYVSFKFFEGPANKYIKRKYYSKTVI
jgi:peptidoglycan/LPS O-acetylase OafA/YrhL